MTSKIVSGDLLKFSAQYLCHQTNCITRRAAHLAEAVFNEFPYADIYAERYMTGPDVPGDIIIRGNGETQRYVIAILGQYFPGRPQNQNLHIDSPQLRQKYFQSGLDKISLLPDLKSIAFPYGIACGAAGGDWNVYQKKLIIIKRMIK